jgi:hypothetical protein
MPLCPSSPRRPRQGRTRPSTAQARVLSGQPLLDSEVPCAGAHVSGSVLSGSVQVGSLGCCCFQGNLKSLAQLLSFASTPNFVAHRPDTARTLSYSALALRPQATSTQATLVPHWPSPPLGRCCSGLFVRSSGPVLHAGDDFDKVGLQRGAAHEETVDILERFRCRRSLSRPGAPLPHLHRYWAHPSHICAHPCHAPPRASAPRPGRTPAHICTGFE